MLFRTLRDYNYDINTEGKEPFHKFIASCKLAIAGSAVTGGYDTMVARLARNFEDAFVRGGRHVLLWTAVTTTFTTTVLLLTNVRKKNDPWNYFWGAWASCGVIYSFSGNGRLSFTIGLWGSLAASLLKMGHLHGYDPCDFSDAKFDRYRLGFNIEKSPDIRYLKEN